MIILGGILLVLGGIIAWSVWNIRRRLPSLHEAYKLGLEDGKQQAMGEPYRTPSPEPPPAPKSLLEESMKESLALLVTASSTLHGLHKDQ